MVIHGLKGELAHLIIEGIAHWSSCRKENCRECGFVNRVLGLTEHLIFYEIPLPIGINKKARPPAKG